MKLPKEFYTIENIIAALRLVRLFIQELLESRILFFFAKKGRDWLQERLEIALDMIDFLIQLLTKHGDLIEKTIDSIDDLID